MSQKKDVIEVEGKVIEPLPNAMFRVELKMVSRYCPCFRQNPHEFYPYFGRRSFSRALMT